MGKISEYFGFEVSLQYVSSTEKITAIKRVHVYYWLIGPITDYCLIEVQLKLKTTT